MIAASKDLRELSKPFEPTDIEWFITSTTRDKDKGLAVPFITNRAVQDRLDEVCGIDGWRNEYKAFKESEIFGRDGTIEGKKTSYLCGISVWSGKMNEWLTKWDGAEDTEIAELKGGLSSAMKRAAVQWGIGRYLYKLENPWVEIEQKGKSYVMKANQKLVLPAWAMPGGTGTPGITDSRQVMVEIIGQGSKKNEAPRQQTGSRKGLSEKQVNRALKKADAANMSMDAVLTWIGKKFGAKEIAELTYQQYDELCDALDAAVR